MVVQGEDGSSFFKNWYTTRISTLSFPLLKSLNYFTVNMFCKSYLYADDTCTSFMNSILIFKF